jgi:DNA-binding FrmR family transcriptional regulator
MNGYTDNKADLRKWLSRVEGQVRGIARMVDEDKYCIDILTQVSAATKALETVALSLLSDHLSHCVAEASAEGAKSRQRRSARLTKPLPAWSVHNRHVCLLEGAHDD